MKNKKIMGFNQEKLIQWFLYWTVTGLATFVLVFLVTATWIGVSVKEKCLIAEGKYGGDCTHALMLTLDDESNSYRVRNEAIWALGQLGDQKAKSTIERYYTGNIPTREPYDVDLSQHEMQKALKLLDGDFNITHLVWRID